MLQNTTSVRRFSRHLRMGAIFTAFYHSHKHPERRRAVLTTHFTPFSCNKTVFIVASFFLRKRAETAVNCGIVEASDCSRCGLLLPRDAGLQRKLKTVAFGVSVC